ncbi:inositol monophosphatase family protein [Ramlibacter sp.]|uniref:inositol monophosphatase family protein n=1 Tax=Ramlibacter sp. TaxID=1917967 RepID=UPI003D0F3821
MPSCPDPGFLDEALAFAEGLANASGAILRENLHTRRGFATKEDDSPVTDIDKHIEETLRTLIRHRYPGHGILGEEFDGKDLDAEYVWVLDPIDGTKAFITGIPIYGTLIALARRGTPILGIIDHPVTNDRWVGAQGRASTFNGKPIRARQCGALADALLSCSNPEPFGPGERAAFEVLRTSTKWCVYGSSCYAYGCVASGSIDIAIDCGRHREVDYCALVPVIEGAGGVITDWEGRPLTIHSGNRLVAAGNPERHAEALRILAAA